MRCIVNVNQSNKMCKWTFSALYIIAMIVVSCVCCIYHRNANNNMYMSKSNYIFMMSARRPTHNYQTWHGTHFVRAHLLSISICCASLHTMTRFKKRFKEMEEKMHGMVGSPHTTPDGWRVIGQINRHQTTTNELLSIFYGMDELHLAILIARLGIYTNISLDLRSRDRAIGKNMFSTIITRNILLMLNVWLS